MFVGSVVIQRQLVVRGLLLMLIVLVSFDLRAEQACKLVVGEPQLLKQTVFETISPLRDRDHIRLGQLRNSGYECLNPPKPDASYLHCTKEVTNDPRVFNAAITMGHQIELPTMAQIKKMSMPFLLEQTRERQVVIGEDEQGLWMSVLQSLPIGNSWVQASIKYRLKCKDSFTDARLMQETPHIE